MRLPTLAGLLAGLVIGLVTLAIVAMSLGPTTIVPPPATLALASATPSPVPSSPEVSGSPEVSRSPGPSGPATSGPLPSGSGPLPSSTLTVGLKVGQLAPALTLPQVGGGTIDLASIRGKPVWLAFTASWCPSCRDELSLMDAAEAQYGDKLAIVAVDVKEDPDTAASLVSQTGFVASMGIDGDGTAQEAFGAFVLPMHYFIDTNGIIRDVLYGEGGVPQFASGLKSVLPGGTATFAP